MNTNPDYTRMWGSQTTEGNEVRITAYNSKGDKQLGIYLGVYWEEGLWHPAVWFEDGLKSNDAIPGDLEFVGIEIDGQKLPRTDGHGPYVLQLRFQNEEVYKAYREIFNV